MEAAALVPGQPSALNTTVATACASVERFLRRYEHAHARMVRALRLLPEPASVERVELLIELTLNEFYRSRYEAMRDWAAPAVSAAKEVGDAALIAAAAVMPAFADAMTGPTQTARSRRAQAAALVDELSDDELSLRPDAAGWLAIAEVYLDLYAEADAHASRALGLTRASGQGDPLHRLYPVLPRVWYVRGKLAEATELLDGAIEAARLLGSPPALAGNLFNRSVVALAVGDLDIALATAEESGSARRLRRVALPPKRGARAGKARPSPPPAHAAGQGQRGRHRVADRTRTPGGLARRRPQDQPADRRGTVLEPEDRRDPPAQHLPQDGRHDTRRPRAHRRTHRPNSEPSTEIDRGVGGSYRKALIRTHQVGHPRVVSARQVDGGKVPVGQGAQE
jgi:hypothetical protein